MDDFSFLSILQAAGTRVQGRWFCSLQDCGTTPSLMFCNVLYIFVPLQSILEGTGPKDEETCEKDSEEVLTNDGAFVCLHYFVL